MPVPMACLRAFRSWSFFRPAFSVARYTRTFTNRWFHAHWIVNFLISCPLILAAWVLGKKAHNFGHASLTPHGKRGLFVIGLYIGQLVLGLVIHYIRIPFPSLGHRPPQNFLHAVQGLVILGLANYQVYDGIYHKTGFLAADCQTVCEARLGGISHRTLDSDHAIFCATAAEFIRTDFLGPVCLRVDSIASPVYTRAKGQAKEK
ncbi:hypothetical protein EDB83DRAFT_875711 [Lactarius deliciosus]|nr:hypothetical protein EDB83DRAFT_875711 [Lactarius deliciosus]